MVILYVVIFQVSCSAESGIPYNVVAAVDINPVAKKIYQRNFPTTKLLCKCLTVIYATYLYIV